MSYGGKYYSKESDTPYKYVVGVGAPQEYTRANSRFRGGYF